MTSYEVDSFLAYTAGIVVYLTGANLTSRFQFLRNFNIPEPVSGGLVAAVLIFAVYVMFDVEVSFDLEKRDLLLVYFFTAIGLNSRLSDLKVGGRPLLILAFLTVAIIVVQNGVGVLSSQAMGLPASIGLITGSASLVGGHGTAIAWAPEFQAAGISNALELGVASATLGLVIASLIGGPVARHLIKRHKLSGSEHRPVVGLAYEAEQKINHQSIMIVILTLHIAMILGWIGHQALLNSGLKLPLFVCCLISAILLTNTVPRVFSDSPWPARTAALALVTDFSLGLFLAMSLMSMQLWVIADLAGPLLVILLLQTLAAVLVSLVILFQMMGRDYQAAVLSSGFCGFALGATPTAIANMTAVTKAHGPAPMAFIILPLVSAFFVDISNAVVLKSALSFFG